MNQILKYFEAHPQFINLTIFLISLIVAWLSGALKAINRFAKKLENKIRISLEPASNRITILREFKYNNQKAQRFAIWLSLRIMNPTEKIQTITEFTLQFNTNQNNWSKELSPITFPNIPRLKVGDNIKFLPVYFTHFAGIENLFGKEFTPSGSLQPSEMQNGYLLFIEEFYGVWLPKFTSRGVKIRLKCKDLRGKSFKVIDYATFLSKEKTYEIIPGLDKYEEDEKYLSSLFRWEQSIDPRSDLGKKIKKSIDTINIKKPANKSN